MNQANVFFNGETKADQEVYFCAENEMISMRNLLKCLREANTEHFNDVIKQMNAIKIEKIDLKLADDEVGVNLRTEFIIKKINQVIDSIQKPDTNTRAKPSTREANPGHFNDILTQMNTSNTTKIGSLNAHIIFAPKHESLWINNQHSDEESAEKIIHQKISEMLSDKPVETMRQIEKLLCDKIDEIIEFINQST
jgi:hypothetical protein